MPEKEKKIRENKQHEINERETEMRREYKQKQFDRVYIDVFDSLGIMEFMLWKIIALIFALMTFFGLSIFSIIGLIIWWFGD